MRFLTRWFQAPSIRAAACSLAAGLLLGACGGGDADSNKTASAGSSAQTRTVSTAAVAVTPAQATVTGLVKLSEKRISRTVYEYVFRVTVSSGPTALSQVTATLAAVGAGSSIVDGTVQTGPMAAQSQVTPANDTITLRHDRTLAFNAAALVWNIVAVPLPTGTVSVVVKDVGGAFLSGASVTVGGASGQTDAQGYAQLTGVLAGTETVVQVKRAGYVTQALRFTPFAQQDNPLTIQLLGIGDSLAIPDIGAAQTFASRSLNAQIKVPANAFVRPDGSPASGPAVLHLTPWNVQSGVELLGMPGNGRARDATGALVDLISAGMMSVEFVDATGQPLQLAPGKTAHIQMLLPFFELNGVSLVPGTVIPMWHFDEAQGLWIEEGQGTVQATGAFGSGLVVEAEVSHFSTWNWDMKFTAPGSLTVKCQLPDNTEVACTVVADVTLPNGGGRFTRMGQAPVGGTTIVNMPNDPDLAIAWQAYDSHGYSGSATSQGVGSTVVITIDPTVRTHHVVRCLKPEATGLFCKVNAYYYASLTDFEPRVLNLTVPAEGAVVETGFTAPRVVFEVAQASEAQGLDVTIYQGFVELTGAAAANGPADIPLSVRRTYTSSPLPVRCSAQALVDPELSTTTPIDRCVVNLNGNYDSSDGWSLTVELPTGVVNSVLVPPYSYGYATAEFQAPGQELPFFGSYYQNLPEYGSGTVLEFDFTQPPLVPAS